MKKSQKKILDELSNNLLDKKLTIAVAESCTAGLLMNILSLAPQAMSFLQGGMVVYNIGQKAKHLNINPIVAQENNAVSEPIAEKMASEVAHRFNAEIGIAITGFAQPILEENIKDCFAYFAISLHGKTIVSKQLFGDSKKLLFSNQEIYATQILKELLNQLR